MQTQWICLSECCLGLQAVLGLIEYHSALTPTHSCSRFWQHAYMALLLLTSRLLSLLHARYSSHCHVDIGVQCKRETHTFTQIEQSRVSGTDENSSSSGRSSYETSCKRLHRSEVLQARSDVSCRVSLGLSFLNDEELSYFSFLKVSQEEQISRSRTGKGRVM